MRFISIFLLGAAIFFSHCAKDNKDPQNSLESFVHAKLTSKQPSEIAWGAYLSRKYNLMGEIPTIHSTLENLSQFGEAPFLASSLLDSLIYFKETVSSDLLIKISKQYPILKNDVLILLVQNAFLDNALDSTANDQTKTILALLHELNEWNNDYIGWFAIANALAKNKTPGFVESLLSQLTVDLVVYIDSPKKQSDRVGTITDLQPGESVQVPAGFPPTSIYELYVADQAPIATTLFSPGIRSVVYGRQEMAGSMITIHVSRPSMNFNQDRVKYLLLLAENQNLQFSSQYEINLIWKDLAKYKRAVDDQKKIIQANYDVLLNELVKQRRLSAPDISKYKLQLNTHVLDFRRDKTVWIE